MDVFVAIGDPTRYDIRRCEPPHVLRVHTTDGFGTWDLIVELIEEDGVTTLTLSQIVDDPVTIENTGPGWEYYLDRLSTRSASTTASLHSASATSRSSQRWPSATVRPAESGRPWARSRPVLPAEPRCGIVAECVLDAEAGRRGEIAG
ncbi:hypothetical protein QSJ19_20480 [Gordonia sp. ABSL11-1]|uniref:hypothetical protein n=1 Tax=Gordonia sp. ABSL11-1 TaxID=3053924 RepID=UPI0025731DD4|nr:hypothetical protein [Gordonia sp. ABSL11-1]MDL9947913.1 hypothetical protein [Gordonia sp. ABSL11-1]